MTLKLIFTYSFFCIIFFCKQPETRIPNQSKSTDKNSTLQYKKKDIPNEKNSFNRIDFENTIIAAKKFHLDKSKINESVGYADAASAACESLNKKLFFFPEKYYEKNKDLDKNIPKGKIIKLSPNDSFLLIQADKNTNDINLEAGNPKELAAAELRKKKEIYGFLLELNFTFSDFERVISYIQSNINSFQIKGEKLITLNEVYLAASNGYLSSIDPYSTVFAREKIENSMNNANSTQAGVGMILSGGGNREVIIDNPLEDRPAVKAGIRSGDIILKIDDKSVQGMSLSNVTKLLRGEKDSVVKLEIKRMGLAKTLTIPIKRDNIEIKNVTGKILNQSFIYIKVAGFVKSDSEDTVKEIKSNFQNLESEAKSKNIKIRGIILDLRNNSGGYLDLAIDTIALFVRKGLLLRTINANREPDEWFATKADISDLPLAVFVNGHTASGAELVAGSLQDNKRGIVMGERTFGNGSIQKLLDFPDNSDYILKITNGRFFLPSGNTPQVHGLRPDILVSSEKDGSFPYVFREEDKWKHLPEIPFIENPNPRFKINEIQNWVQKNGKAKVEIEKRKNDPIQPDYFLYRALDSFNGYLEIEANSK